MVNLAGAVNAPYWNVAPSTCAFTASVLNLAFWAVLLYVSFAILPLWAAISLIGIKLAIPVAKIIKYVTVANRLIKNDKNINKKLLSIRLKIANKEKWSTSIKVMSTIM